MITVFGSINVDLVTRVASFPAPGETVTAENYEIVPGGKGANQALAACRAGAQTRMVGSVGSDMYAEQALHFLRTSKVDLDFLKKVPGTTGLAFIQVDKTGENQITIFEGANGKCNTLLAKTAVLQMQQADTLLLQQEIPQEAIAIALKCARAKGIISVLNIAPFRISCAALAQEADIVIANEQEFKALSPGADPQITKAQSWANKFGRILIVTMGARGAALAIPGKDIFVAPASSITPIDTTGAGDTFCGYFCAAFDKGLSPQAALEIGVDAASRACQNRGAQTSIIRVNPIC